jgi:alpha-glucoside transport system substrate-binding protein
MVKRQSTLAAFAAVVVLIVGACGPAATPSPSSPAATTPAATTPAATGAAPTQGAVPTAVPEANLPKVPTGYAELDKALGADQPYKGTKVSVQSQWTGGEEQGFLAAIADFTKATGITVQHDSIGSSHETVLKTRIEGGSPPDIAQLAQPTGVLAYAAKGQVKDIAVIVGADGAAKLKAEFASTIGLTSEGDHIWSIPTKADVKSMFWYPVKAFAAKGYAVPKTWDELVTLSDKIIADGSHPWCVSAGGPGTATGWELTDWIEEVLAKSEPPEVTADWISHKITFQDPKIKAVFDRVGGLLFKQGAIDGGGAQAVNNDLKTAMDPMFEGDTLTPGCWMQKIPTWYGPDFFPDRRTNGGDSKYKIGDDGDIGIAPFPTISEQYKGVEGSADSFMVLVDRPEVRALAEFLATPEGLKGWITSVGVLSPNSKVPAEWYAGNYKLKVANQILSGATAVIFDASDLMPPSVGGGSFWTQISDWANNNGSNTDAVLKAIDESWP